MNTLFHDDEIVVNLALQLDKNFARERDVFLWKILAASGHNSLYHTSQKNEEAFTKARQEADQYLLCYFSASKLPLEAPLEQSIARAKIFIPFFSLEAAKALLAFRSCFLTVEQAYYEYVKEKTDLTIIKPSVSAIFDFERDTVLCMGYSAEWSQNHAEEVLFQLRQKLGQEISDHFYNLLKPEQAKEYEEFIVGKDYSLMDVYKMLYIFMPGAGPKPQIFEEELVPILTEFRAQMLSH